MNQNCTERQSRQDQTIYSRIERVIAYKNIQFILEHQNDTLEQLSAYLQSCMEDIGHPPAMVEVIHPIPLWIVAKGYPNLLRRQDHQHQKPTAFQRTQDRPRPVRISTRTDG